MIAIDSGQLASIKDRYAGKALVFTNGVFDVLHAGHVRYLQQARELGDALVVGVNSDASARSLGKGPGRPVNSQEDRVAVLRALRAVDEVIVFHESTPEALLKELQPQIHVKGGDYREESLPEAPIVRGYGGQIVILPLLEGRSSTSILQRAGLE